MSSSGEPKKVELYTLDDPFVKRPDPIVGRPKYQPALWGLIMAGFDNLAFALVDYFFETEIMSGYAHVVVNVLKNYFKNYTATARKTTRASNEQHEKILMLCEHLMFWFGIKWAYGNYLEEHDADDSGDDHEHNLMQIPGGYLVWDRIVCIINNAESCTAEKKHRVIKALCNTLMRCIRSCQLIRADDSHESDIHENL